MATKIANARKAFNWQIEIDGVNQFEIQKVKLPDATLDVTEHGNGNTKVKTAGMLNIGEMSLEKIKPMPGADFFAWQWLTAAQDGTTGRGGLAEDYKRIVVVKELHPATGRVLNRYFCEGVWCSKISQGDYDRMSSDNIIQTLTLQVDNIRPL